MNSSSIREANEKFPCPENRYGDFPIDFAVRDAAAPVQGADPDGASPEVRSNLSTTAASK